MFYLNTTQQPTIKKVRTTELTMTQVENIMLGYTDDIDVINDYMRVYAELSDTDKIDFINSILGIK